MANLYDLEVKLVETIPQIGMKIGDNLAKELNIKFRRSVVRASILLGIRTGLKAVLRQSSTYQTLLTPGSELYHKLGLLNGSSRLEAIVNTWANSVSVHISSFRRVSTYGVQGAIHIYGVESDYTDVLGMPASKFLSSNMKGDITEVPWLEWLLLRGRSFVAPGYMYARGSQYAPWSRTGYGIMVKLRRGGGRSWQVPSDHSGLQYNNWVTRAIYGLDGNTGMESWIVATVNNALR